MDHRLFLFGLLLGLASLTDGSTQFFLPLFPAAYLPHVVGTGAGLGAVALLKLKSVAAAKAFVYLRDQGVFGKTFVNENRYNIKKNFHYGLPGNFYFKLFT